MPKARLKHFFSPEFLEELNGVKLNKFRPERMIRTLDVRELNKIGLFIVPKHLNLVAVELPAFAIEYLCRKAREKELEIY